MLPEVLYSVAFRFVSNTNIGTLRQICRKRPGAYKELVQREQRQTAMENAALRMEIEKAAMVC